MADFQFVQVFAILSLLMILLRRDPRMQASRLSGVTLLFVLLGLQALASGIAAYDGVPRNWEICLDLLKTLLFCLLMPVLVTSRLRVHAMLLMLALGLALHGTIEGLKFVASGGAHITEGNAKFGDRNHFAILVVMGMPLLLYLFSYSRLRFVRLSVLAALVIAALAVVSTYSRAGLVTLIAIGLWMLLRGRRKLLSLSIILALAVLVVTIAPDAWVDRMSTIRAAEDDTSFMGRVKAWKRASAIALSNPMTGGGFHSVQSPAVFERFRYEQGFLGFIETTPQPYPVAAHSIYFEVLGDMGFPGLLLFLATMLSPFVVLRRVNKLARAIGPPARWAADLGAMLSFSMVAYLVGGASISAAYFELPYELVMLSLVVMRVLEAEADARNPAAGPRAPQPAAGLQTMPSRSLPGV
jgi:probable O-glycosylation ligase (exosortase A-associated)